MAPNGDPIQSYINKVRGKAPGAELQDREFQALLFGWLADRFQSSLAGRDAPTFVDKAKQVGVPAVATGGVLAAILKLLELFGQ